jgi:site-specific recombinase XerD
MVSKEIGMNRLYGVPQLRRLPFLGPKSQQLMAAYLASLSARHYSFKILQATVGIIKSFCVRLPVACQARLYPDLTQATTEDIDAWLDAAHYDSLAPSTLNNILNGLHRFFAFLQEQGISRPIAD